MTLVKKYIRWLFVFLFTLVLVSCGLKNDAANKLENNQGNGEENKEVNDTIEYSDRGGFLWKVENGDTKVYLQGTIHLGNEDTFPLNKHAETSYEEADVVMPEIDLTEINMVETQTMFMEYGTYDEDKTIADDINKESVERLEEIVEEAGIPFELVESFKPWYIDSLLLELALEETPFSSDYSVDSYFLDRAVEDEKEVIELESFDSQLALLSGFSMEHQIKSLETTIEMYQEAAKEIEEMFNVWLKGDVDKMTEYAKASFEENSEYKEKMNDERNIDMAASIKEILEEDDGRTYFVIVGSMHYIAEPSIISILEENYDVEHIY